MARFEDLKPSVQVKGILPQQAVTIVDASWHGTAAVEISDKRPGGRPSNQLLYRSDEENLVIHATRQKWDFTASGDTFHLAAEAFHIHLAHLFAPVLAVHTSLPQELTMQKTAVSLSNE